VTSITTVSSKFEDWKQRNYFIFIRPYARNVHRWLYTLLDWKFGNDYQEYFGMSADLESMSYLMLANQMLHQFYPHVITIAEVGQYSTNILCFSKPLSTVCWTMWRVP